MERMAPRPKMLVDRKPIFTISPHRLTDRLTPLDTVFGTSSLGIPEVDVADWKLDITGLVNTPVSLSFDDLKSLPKRNLESVFVCSGNPHFPTRPSRKAANVRWTGVDLAELLNDPDFEADPSGKMTKPVWALAPQCMFVSHKQKNDIPDETTELWGWAWSSCPADWVEVSTNGGDTWQRAELEPAQGRAWQRFSFSWQPPGPGGL